MADNQEGNAAAQNLPDAWTSAPGPAHDHKHDHGHFTAANQEHFDKTAKEYDEMPKLQQFARIVVDAMKKEYPSLFNKETTTLLDYACGPGGVFISM